jgi:hypothetical protein
MIKLNKTKTMILKKNEKKENPRFGSVTLFVEPQKQQQHHIIVFLFVVPLLLNVCCTTLLVISPKQGRSN